MKSLSEIEAAIFALVVIAFLLTKAAHYSRKLMWKLLKARLSVYRGEGPVITYISTWQKKDIKLLMLPNIHLTFSAGIAGSRLLHNSIKSSRLLLRLS